jgi:hypothetical protein
MFKPLIVVFDPAVVDQSVTAIGIPFDAKNPAQGRVLVLAVSCGI